MQSETAISRELMGKIVDEVFDGAIEDRSVIEEIYAVIKREEAALSKVPEPKPLDLNITQDWFEKRSALEADHEIGAGSRKLTACIDPTPDELAELFKIAHRIPDGWQLVPVAALSAAEPVGWQWRNPRWTVGDQWQHCPYGPREDKLPGTEYRPVYAAPPAPSVVVKALQAAIEELDRISCVPFVTETRDTYAQLELAKSYADRGSMAAQKALSALSAQVQDVARDLPDEFEKWWNSTDYIKSGGKCMLTYSQRKQLAWDAFYASANTAAPAKQEGGE